MEFTAQREEDKSVKIYELKDAVKEDGTIVKIKELATEQSRESLIQERDDLLAMAEKKQKLLDAYDTVPELVEEVEKEVK